MVKKNILGQRGVSLDRMKTGWGVLKTVFIKEKYKINTYKSFHKLPENGLLEVKKRIQLKATEFLSLHYVVILLI